MISTLPSDAIYIIVKHLNVPEFIRFAGTCRQYRSICDDTLGPTSDSIPDHLRYFPMLALHVLHTNTFNPNPCSDVEFARELGYGKCSSWAPNFHPSRRFL
eukprot:PhF_6_TR29442/c0_g3_i3/m.43628